jgi:nucleoside-diphosphate-sugar epimerase
MEIVVSGTVLILGASGRFGRHAAEAFWNRGWQVKTFDRETEDLGTAAAGVDVIVNAWNPPYTAWECEVPRLTERVIAAAKSSGAAVILPGNVYVFGHDAPPLLRETTPHAASNSLGRVRIEMEAAYRASGVRTIVLRAGDYIDTEASGNWFDAVITAKCTRGTFVAPGDMDADHAWAWLPDLARAAVLLAERLRTLDTFEDLSFPGFNLSMSALHRICEQATGRDLEVRRFPWFAIRVAGLFWPMGRSLVEMRYLWSKPHRLDGTRLQTLLPEFRTTDPLTAITAALNTPVEPDKSVARTEAHIAAE